MEPRLRGTATSPDGRRCHIAFDEAAGTAIVFPEPPPPSEVGTIAPFLPNLFEERAVDPAEAKSKIEEWLELRGFEWAWTHTP
jgi:hypothetical protein